MAVCHESFFSVDILQKTFRKREILLHVYVLTPFIPNFHLEPIFLLLKNYVLYYSYRTKILFKKKWYFANRNLATLPDPRTIELYRRLYNKQYCTQPL